MTLIITFIAAIISTTIWLKYDKSNNLDLRFLSLMYWGASIMWLVDNIVEAVELKAEFLGECMASVADDMVLGVYVIILGILIWLVKLGVEQLKCKLHQA